jgi:pilus assembly protein CpaD
MSHRSNSLPSSTGSHKKALAVLVVAAIGLGGCSAFSASRHEIVGSVPSDYRTRHPIVLTDALAVLDVPATRSMARLPDDARSNVAAFGQKFVGSGAPALAIVIPKGSANQAIAQRTAGEIRDVLAASGVPPQTMDFRSYAALPQDTEAPVRIAFSRVVARTDQCGEWPDQVADTSENRNYENFGCAAQQNLAAIVTNPLDLVYPRAMTPADAERRSNVLEKYRTGAPYQTNYGLESKSSISGFGG